MQTQARITLHCVQYLSRDAIVNLAGIVQVHRVANDNFERALREVKPAFRRKEPRCVEFKERSTLWRCISILSRYSAKTLFTASIMRCSTWPVIGLGVERERDLMP